MALNNQNCILEFTTTGTVANIRDIPFYFKSIKHQIAANVKDKFKKQKKTYSTIKRLFTMLSIYSIQSIMAHCILTGLAIA
jgi:hypothetical protein